MNDLFKSEAVKVESLLDAFFRIPLMQRAYVWDSERVETLFRDIKESFDQDPKSQYFIGGMVFSEEGGDKLHVIDGQQRLITLFLLISSVVRRIEKAIETDKTLYSTKNHYHELIRDTRIDESGKAALVYRLELQGENNDSFIDVLQDSGIEKANLSLTERNLLSSKEQLESFLNEFVSIKEILGYIKYVSQQVYVVRTVAKDQKSAFTIFETLNYRSLPLEPEDLLKNLLLQHIPEKQYSVFETKWEKFISNLTTSKGKYILPVSSFLKHFIMSKGVYISKADIYKWFKEDWAHDNGSIEAVNSLLDELTECSIKYKEFYTGKSTNSIIRDLKRLLFRQGYIVLLASIKLKEKEFLRVCSAVEKVAFSYVVSGAKTNELERFFCNPISTLLRDAVNDASKIDEAIEKLKSKALEQKTAVINRLREMDYSKRIDERKVRYILNKLANSLDGHDYTGDNFTIEHIWPEDKSKIQPEIPDETYREIIYRLGNLTILSKSDNSSIKNETPTLKWKVYKKTPIRLTSSLVEELKPIGNTMHDKAIRSYNYIPPKSAIWSEEEIARRANAMLTLVEYIWYQ